MLKFTKLKEIYTKVDRLDSSKWRTSLKSTNLGNVKNWHKCHKIPFIAQISGKVDKIPTNRTNFQIEVFPDVFSPFYRKPE